MKALMASRWSTLLIRQNGTQYYLLIAREFFLLTSGGSHFHGGGRNDLDSLGRYTISPEELDAIRRNAGSPR